MKSLKSTCAPECLTCETTSHTRNAVSHVIKSFVMMLCLSLNPHFSCVTVKFGRFEERELRLPPRYREGCHARRWGSVYSTNAILLFSVIFFKCPVILGYFFGVCPGMSSFSDMSSIVLSCIIINDRKSSLMVDFK